MTRNTRLTHASAVTGGALALTLLLAGCGGADSTDPANGSAASNSPAGSPTASPTGTPAAGPHNDADIAFAADMIPHHAQAVEMSNLLLAKDADPAVKALADQIKNAQGPEIEQMRGWLAGWGAPVPDADGALTGTGGMDHSGGSMPGMMDEDQMASLADASGPDAVEMFLENMVVHHRGAIEAAKTELSEGENADAKQLAQRIITAQESEIASMTELLGS